MPVVDHVGACALSSRGADAPQAAAAIAAAAAAAAAHYYAQSRIEAPASRHLKKRRASAAAAAPADAKRATQPQDAALWPPQEEEDASAAAAALWPSLHDDASAAAAALWPPPHEEEEVDASAAAAALWPPPHEEEEVDASAAAAALWPPPHEEEVDVAAPQEEEEPAALQEEEEEVNGAAAAPQQLHEEEEVNAAAAAADGFLLEWMRQRSAATTLKRMFRLPATRVALALARIRRRSAAATLKRTLRRFTSRFGVRAVLSNLEAQEANPARMTRIEWARRAQLPKVKQALDAMLQMLSRVCCRRIAVQLAAAPQPQRLRLLRAHQACRVDFAESFFVAQYTPPPSAAAAAPRQGAAREELKEAVADLGVSPDRFSMLDVEQRMKLKAVGARLVRSYSDLVGELLLLPTPHPASSSKERIRLNTALAYEIALDEYSDTCRRYQQQHLPLLDHHRGGGGGDDHDHDDDDPSYYYYYYYNTPSGVQAAIDHLLFELAQSLERILKRSRIIRAAKAAAALLVCPRQSNERGGLMAMIVAQEDHIGNIAPRIATKLSELMRIIGGVPLLPVPLLQRTQAVFVEALSATSGREMRAAALALAKTLLMTQQQQQQHPFVKEAAMHIYAAAARVDAASIAPVLQIADIGNALRIIAALPPSHAAPGDTMMQMKIDVWQVTRLSLRQRHTGVAAHLLREAMGALKLAGEYSVSQHGAILARGAGGGLHADALLESPQRALEVRHTPRPRFTPPHRAATSHAPRRAQVAGPYLAILDCAVGDALFAAFTELASTTVDASAAVMDPADALADTVLLFIKAVWRLAAQLRCRVYNARMLLLCDLLAAAEKD